MTDCTRILQFNFEGRNDLVKFVKTVAEAGLYVHLRIGPYVCAEWNYGYDFFINFCSSCSIAVTGLFGFPFSFSFFGNKEIAWFTIFLKIFHVTLCFRYWTVAFLFGCILYPALSCGLIMSRTRFLIPFIPIAQFCVFLSCLLRIFSTSLVDWNICGFRQKCSDSRPWSLIWWRRKSFMHLRVGPSFYPRLNFLFDFIVLPNFGVWDFGFC